MPSIDCATAGAQNRGVGEASGTQGAGRFHGTPQQKADHLVRAIVLHDLGQKGSSVQGLAAALSKVLSASDVAGTDTPDEVLKKIEVSLKKAAQALADRGYDAKTIDATIDKFRAQLADALDSRGGTPDTTTPSTPPATTPTPPATQNDTTRIDKVVAREVRKQRGAIEILTAEGDQVSIRFRTKEVTTDGVKQTTAADGTTTTATRGSVISRGRLQVEVDGDLNDDELAAIGDLLGKVDALATKFFSGDVQAAFAAAADLGVDSDQIASYQLDLTYSRKVAIAAWSSAASSQGSRAHPAVQLLSRSSLSASADVTAAPAIASDVPASAPTSGGAAGAAADEATTDPVSTGDSTTTTAPVSDAGSAGATDPASGTDPTDAAPIVPAAPATPAPASAQKTIADYIGDVLSKLGSVEGTGRISFSMRFKMNVLVTALETLKPPATTPASGTAPPADSTQLLGDSLQSAVA